MKRIQIALASVTLLAFAGVPPEPRRLLAFDGEAKALVTGLTPSRPAAVQAPATSMVDVERARAYNDRIVSTARRLPPRTSLAELVRLVMQGTADGATAAGDVANEHRTALVVLAVYVNGWKLQAIVPEARAWPRAERRNVVLRGRHDLSQHFMVSAVIAAFAGTPIANAVGLYKEMDDARSGSGFSFSDLAADRAGTTFGDMATRSPESARLLQSRLSAGLTENDMMPEVSGLPEKLSQAEFTRRFGAAAGPAYNQLVDEIERRVAALALFQ